MATSVFGPNVSVVAYFSVILIATFSGGWLSVLLGVGMENKKLSQFHESIQYGQYLFLIYARKGKGEMIKAMMRDRHPESEYAATDEHFMTPFSDVVRRKHVASQ